MLPAVGAAQRPAKRAAGRAAAPPTTTVSGAVPAPIAPASQPAAPYLHEAALAAICPRRTHLTHSGEQANYFGDNGAGGKKLLLQVGISSGASAA